MTVNELQSLQNANMEPDISSITFFLLLLIFGGGAFTLTKKKIKAAPWYTRLNPNFFLPGFTTVEKFNFDPPKKQINLWNRDKLQIKFDPKNFSK